MLPEELQDETVDKGKPEKQSCMEFATKQTWRGRNSGQMRPKLLFLLRYNESYVGHHPHHESRVMQHYLVRVHFFIERGKLVRVYG